ncbi:MAG: hypothetical protein IJX91_05605 [Clostridia bacterium]|nr:hypothetical protein [Clostridia bacterium]
MLYVIIVAVAMLLISTVVALATSVSYLHVLGLTTVAVISVVAIDGLTATVCRLLPAKFADHEKRVFKVSAEEKKFYEKLKIRKWKDRVPEIGQFTGFRKNKLDDPKNPEYIDRFLLETCYGEIGHFTSMFTSFLILLLFSISKLWLAVAIPVAVVSALLNLPSFIILRYNSYKLEVLRKSALRKLEWERKKETEREVAATVTD